MDWIHTRLPAQRFNGEEYEVWLDDGSVRTCRIQQGLCSVMVLTDCRSPLSNALLQEHRVKAWRVTGRHPQQIALEGKRKPSPAPAIRPGQYQSASLQSNPMSGLYQMQDAFAPRTDNPMAANYQMARYI